MKQTVVSGSSYLPGTVKEEDGKKFVYLYVPSACTINTPYAFFSCKSGTQIPQMAALGAKDTKYRVVVATETLAAAGYSWFQFAGPYDDLVVDTDTYVVADMVGIYDAVTTPSAATTVTPDDFAVVAVVTSTTAIDVYLLDREITAGGA
jgi:hypothetical protein